MTCRDAVDLFLERVHAQPNRPAVVARGRTVAYGELENRVRRIANRFADISAPRVLIALPQGADAYASMFAAGLSGGLYTPVNIAAPIAKLRRIARSLQPHFIVGGAQITRDLAAEAPGAIALDPAGLSGGDRLEGPGIRHEIAYVMFTSGSTGTPKGVMIPRHALDHYVDWVVGALAIEPADRVSQHPNIAFDMSVTDIYGALCSGATLCPVASETDRLMPARLIEREKITVWNSVASVANLMARAREATSAKLGSVRLFVFSGEPLLREHLDTVFRACPRARVVNAYGPTEATVETTALWMTAGDHEAACGASVAIGDAIPGMAIHLVGGANADEGEIAITGPQLALGYWQEPEQTARAFRTVTVAGEQVRAYFTGDWAERRGRHIFFRERIDFQVKIRGFRLELDEVGAAIRECGWPVVCVFKWNDAVAAVIEQRDDKHFDETALRASLRFKLESHAVPAVIRLIPRMPRNENDKLDRAAVVTWFETAAFGDSELR